MPSPDERSVTPDVSSEIVVPDPELHKHLS